MATFGLGVAAWVLLSTQGFAFTVFSKGVSYDIEIVTLKSGTTFNDANSGGALTASPWFGDFALAREVAAALPASLFETQSEIFLPYRYSLAGLTVNSIVSTETGKHIDLFRNRNASAFRVFDGTLSQSQAWAIGTAKSAPEIDGPSLAQALFILLAAILLRGRLRRCYQSGRWQSGRWHGISPPEGRSEWRAQ
ncbi:MAG: hypothetical protein AAGB05_00030 [Pseudomonadota bacterium]